MGFGKIQYARDHIFAQTLINIDDLHCSSNEFPSHLSAGMDLSRSCRGGGGGGCSDVVLCQSCSPPIPHGGWSHSSRHIRQYK